MVQEGKALAFIRGGSAVMGKRHKREPTMVRIIILAALVGSIPAIVLTLFGY